MCLYYVGASSYLCNLTKFCFSHGNMLIQSLQNHFNNTGDMNNHSSINACVVSGGQLNSVLVRFGEVTVENNTEIPDLKEDIAEVTMIAWIISACFLKCVLN